MSPEPGFDEFYREMHPRLWGYLARTTRVASVADDLAQESFVRLLASSRATLPIDQRKAYLFRIAENLVRDTHRRRIREKTGPTTEAMEPMAASSDAPARVDITAAFATLGDRDRRLLWLAHVEEWTHAEIAGLLGLATGSIRVLLHRARRRLQERLQEGRNP